MLPYVSVVVPFRNATAWLGECLASLRCQQGVNLELVAVDDGSTDCSSDLVISLSRGAPWQLRLLQSGGGGVSAARNLGWRAAAAELVAFLDADDLAYPGRLAAQAALFTDAPQLEHCLCGWQRLSVSGQPLVEVCPWLQGAGFSHELALTYKAVLPSAWMLRRSVLDRLGGFDPTLHQAEDVDLLLRLAASGSAGAWLEQVACGYRVHPSGASRQLRAQARGLLFVIERHLARSHDPPIPAALAAQVRYTTRAWLGWQAWAGGDPDRAQELWTTALGLSPLPPALTWVHLLENVERSGLGEGRREEASRLLADPLWARLEALWCRRMLSSRPLPYRDGTQPHSAWREVLAAASNQALLRWRSSLIEQLGPDPSQSPWWSERLRRGLAPDDALRTLRLRVLSWIEQLLCWQPDDPLQGSESLRRELAAVLLAWAVLVWPEARRAAYARLEESAAIWPNRQTLLALSRLQRSNSPSGAAGLAQLASRLPPLAAPVPELPTSLAYWERPQHRFDSCHGPQCSACINADLRHWRAESLGSVLVRWHAPVNDQSQLLQIEADAPLPVRELAWGRAWLRPPLTNPWQSSHAVAVATADGLPILDLCRRYPQPWLSCNQPASDPEPEPSFPPLRLEAAVLAVVDLSAETYYHWLLEQLPRLGLALEALAGDPDLPRLLIWHNGGHGASVSEALRQRLGLPSERLLDARLHPHIQARRLLVPDFPSPFGWPAPRVQRWLRRFWLGEAAPTRPCPGGIRLWLQRGDAKGRRPVGGEAETLAKLAHLGLTVVNPARLTIAEQAKLVASAAVVISPHGSALANLVFAAPGTRVLELHQPRYAPPYFHGIAQYGRLDLFRSVQPSVAPESLQELFYEGASLEPIQLEPQLVEPALVKVLNADSLH